MKAVQIKQLTEQDVQRWDNYVEQAQAATFFHRAGWRRVLEQAFGHQGRFLYAERDGAITGILPLGHIRSRIFGNSLVSTPFCVYGGIVADDEAARQALEQAAIELAQALGVDCLELRNQSPQHKDWPAKRDLYVTFRKAIDPDLDQNMQNIPRKQRAMVRKGIKAGLESAWDENIERLYDAYSQSVHALGTPVFSKRYFQVLKQVFGDDCRILSVTQDGQLVASVMNFYFKDQVLPYYGGGTELARAVKGNDFMYWEVMRHACETGVKVFDYGRSKVGTGSYSFKKNWGFEPEPLHYEYVLVKADAVPDVNPLNPKYRLFIGAWKKMPLAMTRMIGPHIVKNLG
ncbi:peptidoglycan bridge formation protein FemAB [Candidatus Tenderia electrophaga]|uniref:Peptidoglycan bridge formation protein FemAB n=1 Tax=Candidatus Tenderia electrophaga TaxID=1748243 RepID=A0A0S2TI82_9GAMM|nr:peptidoglycan bridge formation protein FemAB [Candidatus Tenderia electrophaga]